MATSGTTTFDLSIEEIIQEAYERCGMATTSGHSLRSARTSLNLLFAEWANRGIHLWKVSLHENQLICLKILFNPISYFSIINSNTFEITSLSFGML